LVAARTSPIIRPSPIRPSEADVEFGVHLTARGVNPSGCTTNCINVATAVDARLAGETSAIAEASGYKPVETLIEEGSKFFGRNFVKTWGPAQITRIMQSWGPGSRGIIYGQRGGIPGHSFNVVNRNGVVVFTDAGLAPAWQGQGYTFFYLLRTQ
jgi:hypothetical protein